MAKIGADRRLERAANKILARHGSPELMQLMPEGASELDQYNSAFDEFGLEDGIFVEADMISSHSGILAPWHGRLPATDALVPHVRAYPYLIKRSSQL
jgi:hypothetical protein